MISQANITPNTPMGATLTAGGATFRTWAPRATAVYVNGVFGGVAQPALESAQADDMLMLRDANGYWSGFLAGAADGDLYRFYVVGAGSSGYKGAIPTRGEMALDASFPDCRIASSAPARPILGTTRALSRRTSRT